MEEQKKTTMDWVKIVGKEILIALLFITLVGTVASYFVSTGSGAIGLLAYIIFKAYTARNKSDK